MGARENRGREGNERGGEERKSGRYKFSKRAESGRNYATTLYSISQSKGQKGPRRPSKN